MEQVKVKRLGKLIRLMAPLHVKLYLAVLCAVGGFVTTVSIPALIIHLAFTKTNMNMLLYGLILVMLGLLRGLFRYGEHYFGHYIAFRVLANFRNMIFEKLRRLVPAKLDTKDSGVLLKMIGEDIEAIEVFFAHTLPPILTASIVALGLFIYFLCLSWLMAILALLTYCLLSIVLPIGFSKKLQPLMTNHQVARKQYMQHFLDSLKGMSDLRQFNQTNQRFSALKQESEYVNKREQEMAQMQAQQTSVTFFVVGLSIASIALLSIYLVQQQSLSLESALISIVVFSTSFPPFLELSRLPFGLKKALKAANEVFDLLEEVEVVDNGVDEIAYIGEIKADAVTFAYPQREQIIFDKLNAEFQPNQIIGLVGASGSGKSTLMKLIMRWYNIQKGTLLINSKDSQEWDRKKLQAKIAYIPQKAQIFSQTLRENLVLHNNTITDDMILDMAEKCQMKERILDLPQGLDTLLSSENIPFSSGEMQRLELMRALLSGADCYIFDEPTSFLDSLNEALFLKIVKEHCQGTVFLVSHRMSTMSIADVVYRVENQNIQKVGE